MADRHATTLIGSGTFVRGRVTGTGDLEIAGRIEGEVTCSGDVLVDTSGLVGASISARRIVVRGAVKGDLTAEDAVILEAGARVVGDLKAPRIAIAPGGLVRGHVQTGGAGAARPRSAAATASRTSSASSTSAKAAPARAEAKKSAPAAAARSAPAGNGARAVHPAAGVGAKAGASRVGPPPPVVPVLKTGTKAALHASSKKR